MKIKNLLLIIAAALTFSACQNKSFTISGKINDAPGGSYIYLDRLGLQNLESYDSAEVNSEGYFLIEGEVETPEFFLLRANDNSFLTTLVEKGEDMTITASWDSLAYPDFLDGSPGTALLIEYNSRLLETVVELSRLSEVYEENIDSPDLETIMSDLDKRAQGIIGEMNSFTKAYIDDNLTSLAAMIALYQQVSPGVYIMNPEEDLEYFIKVDSTLLDLYPESEPVKNFHEQVALLSQTLNSQKGIQPGLSQGDVAPDFMLPDPSGNEVSLSSTRGNIVLLDFWAAWCPPCRQENPNLVKAYKRFHDKGFEIVQVSLDQTKDVWIKGIEDDNLEEWLHLSDLAYWESVVVSLYNIQGIPTNYLLDREGRIIAANLRGEALIKKLQDIL